MSRDEGGVHSDHEADRVLGGSWSTIPNGLPSIRPAFTSYTLTGWTLWPADPDGGNYRVRRFNNGTPSFVMGALVDIDLKGRRGAWGQPGRHAPA